MAKEFSYYDISKIMSLNATFNFVMGARGLGKTYGFKKFAIDAALKKGHQFIYLRRYKSELISRSQFFVDVQHLYPEWEFRVRGKYFEAAPESTKDDKKRKWTVIGFSIALVVAQNEKSVPFTNVRNIIFDEFIIEKGHVRELPQEAHAFLNFYSTVDRSQDKTRVFFLANTVSIANAYFIAFKIRPDEETELFRKDDGFIACHFPDSEKFKNEVYETKFGKFIKNTEFADFAIESVFSDGHMRMVIPKPSDAKYYCTIEFPMGVISVWYYGGGYYHVQQKRPGNEVIFTFSESDMNEDKTLLVKNDKLVQNLRTAFRHARITFDEPETRNIFIEIFKR